MTDEHEPDFRFAPRMTPRLRAAIDAAKAPVKHITDAYIDQWTEPLKRLYPQRLKFWRPDNKKGLVLDDKPAGYWMAHLLGPFWVIVTLVVMVIVVLTLFGAIGAVVAAGYRAIRTLQMRLDAIPDDVVHRRTRLVTKVDLERCHDRVQASLSQALIDLEMRHERQDEKRTSAILDRIAEHNKTVVDRIDRVESGVTAVHQRIDAHLEKRRD